MAPAKSNTKPTVELNPWGWVSQVKPEDVDRGEVLLSYRISGFQPCQEARRNCKRNPYCIWGLGEKKWKEETEGDDEEEGAAFRCEGEYAGLQNLGATCYVNSLLQLWFHNPIFRPAILKWTPAVGSVVTSESEYKPNCPLSQLQAIFARMKMSKRSKIDPSDFVSSLLLNTGEQQDAQEFAKLFMDFIVKLLTDYGDEQIRRLIAQSFNGQLQYETECLGCKNKTKRSEEFMELNLNVKKNLNESLDDLLADEILSDEYKCSNCHKKNTAKRRMQLINLPPILNLQLLRFVYDREAQRRKKVTQNISFPEVLDMQQRIYNKKSDVASSSSYKYHLTAVLIHNGQSASSGHYIAQIKDLRSGEWLKFNDEFVDPVNKGKGQKQKEDDIDELDKKTKPRKSKNSPSLTSSGAYMLVYTQENFVKNLEPDPELHQYLIDLVKGEDTSFEMEVNKNKSEKDFEQAVRNQRRKEVEWLYEFRKKPAAVNGKSSDSENQGEEPKSKIPRYDDNINKDEISPMEVDEAVEDDKSLDIPKSPCDLTENGSTIEKSNGINSEVSVLPHRKKNYEINEIDFISVDWISQWLDPGNPVPPIENGMLLCTHRKLSPPLPSFNPCLYRVIPSPLANVWYEHYQGGPRLKGIHLCQTCVQVQCQKLRAISELEEDAKHVSEFIKKWDSECAAFTKNGEDLPPLTDKCWVSKESIRHWKKLAKRIIEEQSTSGSGSLNKENEVHAGSEDGSGEGIGPFNVDLFCEHGNLTPDVNSRKIIPIEAWTILEKYFKDAIMLGASEESCRDCRDKEQANSVVAQQNKEIAIKQKASLQDLYFSRNRPDITMVGDLYVISTAFISEWKQFVRDPSRFDIVEDVNNHTLICNHEKFKYPITFVSEFLRFSDNSDEMVCLITPEEWQFIKDNFKWDHEIKVKVVSIDKPDNLEYEPDICNLCAEAWLEMAYRKQFDYDDSPIYVRKREKGDAVESEEEPEPVKDSTLVSGKREAKPFNRDAWMTGFSSNDSVRRSQRPRNTKSEKMYKVSSSMTIKELKSKISADFKAILSDQHLFFDGNELDDLSKTLADYLVPVKSKLFLEIDTAENGSTDEPMSTVELGFQGTLLQGGGGGGLGDTRSPVHKPDES